MSKDKAKNGACVGVIDDPFRNGWGAEGIRGPVKFLPLASTAWRREVGKRHKGGLWAEQVPEAGRPPKQAFAKIATPRFPSL